jgi:hypothetical protein
MFRKIYLTAILGLFSTLAFSQTGTLKGVITNRATGAPVDFANVVIMKNGVQQGGTSTGLDGSFTIKPIDPGTYTVKASFAGFTTFSLEGVVVSANKITYLTGDNAIRMTEGVLVDEIEVKGFTKPLIDQGNISGETKTAKEIVALPTKSVNSIASTTAGIYQKDEGDAINVRGSRSDATSYIVDGIKVRGSLGIPTSAIEQITVVTGGLEAKYGDATGGMIVVTTKGPSNTLFGSLEYESSRLFDDYNYDLLGFALSGPIYRKTNSDGSKGNSVIGFFLSGEFRTVDDSDPSAIGMWKVRDYVLDSLKSTPFVIAPNATAGFLSSSDFLVDSCFENVQAKQNSGNRRFNFSGKLDIKPSKNTFLSIGGTYYNNYSRNYSYWRSMFSWENNSVSTEETYRVFGRLTQKFGDEQSNSEKSSNLIKNAFITLQADYTSNFRRTFHEDFDNYDTDLFKYGHVGKFTTYKAPVYSNGVAIDTITGIPYSGQILSGWRDTLYEFDGTNASNIQGAQYTQSFYDMFEEYSLASPYSFGYGADGIIRTQYDLQGQGLRNGESPASVYSLYGNWGTQYTTARKTKNIQNTIKFSASADVGNHEISFGFEREERKDMYWGASTTSLWTLARLLTNKHISDRNLSNPHPVYDLNGVYQDTVNYDRLFVESDQSVFDFNLRESLIESGYTDVYGQNVDSVTWIDVDNLDPDQLSLNFFSANELLNNGSSYVYYYGFDAFGNPVSGVPTLADYFGRRNSEGDYINSNGEVITENQLSRHVAAFNPIYTAGYIQDKFAINDLLFNIGLRIDNYDANQPVLKDKYLLYEAKFADHVDALSLAGGSHPTSIGDDFNVYVDNIEVPTRIVGYRNGDVWYNENGVQISDPTLLAEAAEGKIAPLLLNPSDAVKGYKTDDAFADYNPETVFMPRIAFSFPISDEAQFFAHYDVLTQRPPQSNRIEPLDYLYMEDNVGALLNNPDLKPEKVIDYELGFAKKLSLSSALKISLFYKELRDMLNVTNVISAYPATYMMYQNIDFGTSKGLSANYDLRRTGRVQMTTNYTLQFADGTGSSASSGYSLVNTGQPNLRTTIPLAYDQRHAISASVDYRYRHGDKYTGPVLFGSKILSDAGLNVMMSAGSGTPYSKQSNITQEAASGINDRSTLSGSLNGSRLPWQFRLNAKFNKNFEIKWTKKKSSYVNAYLQVQNLLDAKNIISVYRATGNPEDDGYLTAAESQNDIMSRNNPGSFMYLYSLAVNNPSHYSLPRTFRMGLSLTF